MTKQKYVGSGNSGFSGIRRYFEFGPAETPHRRLVEVRQDTELFSEPRILLDAEVSWSSIGAVSADEAETFAEAILEAVRMAREWNKDTGKPVEAV